MERSDLYSQEEDEAESIQNQPQKKADVAETVSGNERSQQPAVKDGNILIIQNNLMKRGANLSCANQFEQRQGPSSRTTLPEVHQMSSSGKKENTKKGLDSNVRSLRVDSLPDLKHNQKRSM